MKINSVYSFPQYENVKKDSLKNNYASSHNVSFQGEKSVRVSVALLAAVLGIGTLGGCRAVPSAKGETTSISSTQNIDSTSLFLKENKIQPTDISLIAMPVSEFYAINSDGVTIIEPNLELNRNQKGSVIISVVQSPSKDLLEGCNLDEIINKTYSDVLSETHDGEKGNVYNKIIDEIIQSNPALANYVFSSLGDSADSYSDIAQLYLFGGVDNLILPSEIVYQRQGLDDFRISPHYTVSTYSPSFDVASILPKSSNFKTGEFSSFDKMIYSAYGSDLSNEAYRDILYAIVNDPNNSLLFENNIDFMTDKEIRNVVNINDNNRTLNNNLTGDFTGIFLPTVVTFRTNADENNDDLNGKNLTIYQISPASVFGNQEDKSVPLLSNSNPNGNMIRGEVFKLQDVLQYYSSPDGNSRFASVMNGRLVINDSINYKNEFITNILQQVVYANLPIFTAEYNDENGVYPYGVFDVNEGYDTKGKTLEEIILNSNINIDRMLNYSFVNSDGSSKFESGTELNLPQFNYRINDGETSSKPQVPENDDPTQPTPPCGEPDDDIVVDEEEPTIPDETDPTSPCDDDSDVDVPVDEEEPTIPNETENTTPSTPCEDDSEVDIPVEEEEPAIPNNSSSDSCGDSSYSDVPAEEKEPVIPSSSNNSSGNNSTGNESSGNSSSGNNSSGNESSGNNSSGNNSSGNESSGNSSSGNDSSGNESSGNSSSGNNSSGNNSSGGNSDCGDKGYSDDVVEEEIPTL